MAKLKVKKNDIVFITTGKDKGKSGKVLRMIPKESRVFVEGINMVVKHQKATQVSEGGRIQKEASIHISNVMYADPKTGKPVKLGVKMLESGEKVRFIKKTNEII